MVDNTVTIIGNLTADPEVRVTDSGATLAEIRMAQNKRKRNSDGSWDEGEPMFFSRNSFGNRYGWKCCIHTTKKEWE